jgi:hypothetical protein
MLTIGITATFFGLQYVPRTSKVCDTSIANTVRVG